MRKERINPELEILLSSQNRRHKSTVTRVRGIPSSLFLDSTGITPTMPAIGASQVDC